MSLHRSAAIVVLVMTLNLSGCSVMEHSHNKCATPPVPTVQTGGTYAQPRVLKIPKQGLALSDAVQQSLRPGIIAMLYSGNNLVVPTTPVPAVPITEQTIKARDSIGGALTFRLPGSPDPMRLTKLTSARDEILKVAGVDKLVSEQIISQAEQTALSNSVLATLTSAADDGAFDDTTDTLAARKNKARRIAAADEIYRLIALAPMADIPNPDDARIERTAKCICGLSELPIGAPLYLEVLRKLQEARDRGDFQRQGGDKSVAMQRLLDLSKPISSAPTRASLPEAVGNNLADNLAVTVTRRSGRILVIPLQSVLTFSPGDIQLKNGDFVEIIQYANLSATQPEQEASEKIVAVTTWYDATGAVMPVDTGNPTVERLIADVRALSGDQLPGSDVAVLRRVTANGLLQEYILPLSDAKRLSTTYLRSGDLIHLDMMSLMPLIRNGRDAVIKAPTQPKECCVDAVCKKWTGVSANEIGTEFGRAVGDVNAYTLSVPR